MPQQDIICSRTQLETIRLPKRASVGHLSLTFLGSFQATLAGDAITSFRSSKVQGLLAYLAVTCPLLHDREVLATLFWPNESQTVAKKNLRQSLYQLRQLIDGGRGGPESHLLATRSTAQFNAASDYTLDVAEFLGFLESGQLERSIDAYRGELLPGFACESQAYEDWLRRERERLQGLALGAMYRLAADSLAKADYARAQGWARKQLALEPWREEAHRQLIQALALLGERSAAMAQYERCRAVLDEELGVQPSSDTEALIAKIRRQNVGQRRGPEQGRLSQRRQLEMVFVGRSSEHGTLVRAYERAGVDGPQVVALVGEAGIGKTRLAEQFAMWASAQGADILRGRAFQTSSGLSYQPLTHALRQRLDRVNAPEDLLSDLWLAELARILPELRDRYPDLPETAQDDRTGRQHLFEAITRMCLSLSRRSPMVLFIDDWHWADAASLDALHYAVMGWSEAQAPILVLLTLRQEALAEKLELRTWLNRLKHDVSTYQLHLGTLPETDVQQLVKTMLGVEADGHQARTSRDQNPEDMDRFCRWLFKETDGQPFFLLEVLSSLVEQGLLRPDPGSTAWVPNWPALTERLQDTEARISPGVQERINSWMSRVNEPGRDILTVTAVLGEQATFRRLCQVAALDESRVLTSLDELTNRQLLQETEGLSLNTARDAVYNFPHQMISEVVYAEAGAARRLVLHRRAFDVLRSETRARETVPAAALAHHAFHAGLWTESIEYSIRSGDEAMRMLAVRVAIPHYERARQIVEQDGWPDSILAAGRRAFYLGLGRAYELDEAWEESQKVYLAMVDEARKLVDPTMECEGLNRLATVHINSRRQPRRAIALLKEARAVAEASGDRRGMAETEWNLSLAARTENDSERARQHGEAALGIARQVGEDQLVARCLNSLAYVNARMRQWGNVAQYADEARELYAAVDNRILEADSRRMVGWSRLFSGQPQESVSVLREAYAFSQEIENVWGEAESAWRLAWALQETGQFGEAFNLAVRGANLARAVGQPTMVELAHTTLGTIERHIMALEPARETLVEVVRGVQDRGTAGYADWAMGELCAVCALSAEWGEANAFAKQAVHIRQEHGLPPVGLTGHFEIEALMRGDETLARAEVERLGDLVGGSRRLRLAWLRCQAVLARWDRDSEQAVAHLRSASELAKEIGMPAERWPVLHELGDLFHHQGDHGGARLVWDLAGEIIASLAQTIDEEDARQRFLDAAPVRSVLDSCTKE